jgi:hypothetical protein
MVFAELDRRSRVYSAKRVKLAVQMLTTFAYGALGLAFGEPLVQRSAFGPGHMIAMGFGLFCLFMALYFAPEGERYG